MAEYPFKEKNKADSLNKIYLKGSKDLHVENKTIKY